MRARPIAADEFLASIQSELMQAFSARPDFGSVGFRCIFHDGRLVRIEYELSTSKMTQPDAAT
jgi:hypothetical protein